MKTWEMLRDIREGDVYENVKIDGYGVEMVGGSVKFAHGEAPRLTNAFMTYDWRKRPALVDFATAFAAYEAFKAIRSERGVVFDAKRIVNHLPSFTVADIRGKWEVID